MASAKPASDPPLHATREMLDELDALMERMLALPITDSEEAEVAPPAPANAVPPPKSRPLAPTLTLLQVPSFEETPDPTAWPEATVYALPPLPPAETSESRAAYPELPELPAAPAVAPVPLSERVVPAPEPTLDALLAELPAPPASLASWFILPVLWGNRGFDQATRLLGGFGGWLRGSSGRSVLGIAGLILFGAAVFWLLRDWLGWTW